MERCALILLGRVPAHLEASFTPTLLCVADSGVEKALTLGFPLMSL